MPKEVGDVIWFVEDERKEWGTGKPRLLYHVGNILADGAERREANTYLGYDQAVWVVRGYDPYYYQELSGIWMKGATRAEMKEIGQALLDLTKLKYNL